MRSFFVRLLVVIFVLGAASNLLAGTDQPTPQPSAPLPSDPSTPPGIPDPPMYPPAPPGNKKPKIVEQQYRLLPGWILVVSGRVEDETPGGITVKLGGGPEGLQNKSCVTNANGEFFYECITERGDGGTVTLNCKDMFGVDSDEEYVALFY